MKLALYLVVLIVATCVGFVIHVAEVEWLRGWVSAQMEGLSVSPSWSVRYVAMVFAVEQSIAILIIYLLMRDKVKAHSIPTQIALLSALILAFKMLLIRQPLMDYLIGNPIHVVLAQNLMKWSIPILMSSIIVVGYYLVDRVAGKK